MAGKGNRRPPCSATRRDGSPCTTFARESGLCAYHERLAGAEPLSVPSEPVELAEQGDDVEHGDEHRPPPSPDELRGRFREDAAANYDTLVNSLVEGLAETNSIYVTCSSCGKRHPVQVPNLAGRAKAVETLVSLGYGRQREESTAGGEWAEFYKAMEEAAADDEWVSCSTTEELLALIAMDHMQLAESGEEPVATRDLEPEIRAIVAAAKAGDAEGILHGLGEAIDKKRGVEKEEPRHDWQEVRQRRRSPLTPAVEKEAKKHTTNAWLAADAKSKRAPA